MRPGRASGRRRFGSCRCSRGRGRAAWSRYVPRRRRPLSQHQNCLEFNQVFEILLSSCGFPGRDQRFERQCAKLGRANLHDFRTSERIAIGADARSEVQQVDCTHRRRRRHQWRRAKRACIQNERQTRFDATRVCVPFGQHRNEPIDVVRRRIVANVDVVGEARRAVHSRRHTAHQNESNASLDQRSKNGLKHARCALS